MKDPSGSGGRRARHVPGAAAPLPRDPRQRRQHHPLEPPRQERSGHLVLEPRVSGAELDARCRVTGSVTLDGRVREQRFVILVRDSREEIAVAGTVSAGPLRGPRDRVEFNPRDPDFCEPDWVRAQLIPYFLPEELTRRD